ncbi:MAG: hypothetical protein K6A41_07635 [Bacteroidales bacterium]|nr:hypothetical protein [Bacteroidales bacterium]
MKKVIITVCAVVVTLLFSSCATMDHWLYGASDYFISEEETDVESDHYWDDFEWDLWIDEYEYE